MSKKKHKVIVDVNPHSVCGGKVHERHDGARVRYYSPGYASRNRRSIPRRAAKPFFAGLADAAHSFFTKSPMEDYYDYEYARAAMLREHNERIAELHHTGSPYVGDPFQASNTTSKKVDNNYENKASIGVWTFFIALLSFLPGVFIAGNILGDPSVYTFWSGAALTVAAVYLVGYVISCAVVAAENRDLDADMTVTFKLGTGSVSEEIVLESLTKSYESQILTLCERLAKLRSSPDVSDADYDRAKSSVQDSLTTLAELAEQDVVDSWNGGSMSLGSQSVVDTIDAVNSALKDVKDSRR